MDIRLKKGLDLSLAGAVAPGAAEVAVPVKFCAVCPADFPGFVPKLEVKEGDIVSIGHPLMHDKRDERVKIVSPAAGLVHKVVRGERRSILRVEIKVDQRAWTKYDTAKIATREAAVGLLCASGMLSRMRQRPYDIVPDPAVAPRDIFVTALDTAPLAAPLAPWAEGRKEELKKAVGLLRMVTDGRVYLCVGADWTLGGIAGAEMVNVSGPHPAGLPGVQAANIAPVNKGETIWTLDIATLLKIGSLMQTGQVDTDTVVALTGSEVEQPALLSTIEGAAVAPLLEGRLKKADHHIRVISGNVLTGEAVSPQEGFLHFPWRQITVIPEGDDVAEFMGWASISPKKMSVSRSFPGHFLGKLFRPDARILGGRRAMIMSGEYDRMMPMDILPEYLLKAIIARDIEAMERLGIYEVAPEDFALAEYADTSKIPLQQIVRDGLDYLRKELQ